MQAQLNDRRRRWFVIGVLSTAMGLSGTIVGVAIARWSVPNTRVFEIPVHATATHGQDNYALATALFDNEGEVLFFLDALTGELKAAALNSRSATFQTFFARNIMQDFGPAVPKNPRFLMVTGRQDFSRQANRRFALAAVYVMEISSGKCVAYTVPAPAGRTSLANQKFTGPVIPLDKVEFRKVKVRPGAEAG